MSSQLPINSVIGRLAMPTNHSIGGALSPPWITNRALSWYESIAPWFSAHLERDPLQNYAQQEFAILDSPHVSAGIQLDTRVIILTTAYLSYLRLIATHVATTRLLGVLSKDYPEISAKFELETIKDGISTLARLHAGLGTAHIEGVVDCSFVVDMIDPGKFGDAINEFYSSWIAYTFLHEIGHLDLYDRGINVKPMTEEFYCDAFAIKGWHQDGPLIGFVRDVLLLFTHQWPIDLHLYGQSTHPPTFHRASMLLDAVNINGVFDSLKRSLGDFWDQGERYVSREPLTKARDITSLRYEATHFGKTYAKASNLVYEVAKKVIKGPSKYENLTPCIWK